MAVPVRLDEAQTSMRSGSTPVIACQVSVRLRHGECRPAGRSLLDRIELAGRASLTASSRGPMLAFPRGWDAGPAHAGPGPACGSSGRSSARQPGRLALPGAAAAAIPHQSGHADSGDRPPAMIYTSQNQRSTGQAEVPGHLGRALPDRGRGTLTVSGSAVTLAG